MVLGKLFNNDYLFRMPRYQRPYSWTTEETGELLNDLTGAMNDEVTAEPYFLGSIVLIARPNSPVHDVIDGQQRLTTLTMLFCVLRELTDEDDKRDSLDQRVREMQDVFAGGRDRFRLELREQDQEFFRDKVQARGRIANFLAEGMVHTSDTRKLIFENTSFLWDKLSELSQRECDTLSQFVIRNCYLVVVTAYDRDSAHRIFSVLNARGLDLTPTDILKADVIGEITGNAEDRYTRLWEDVEDELGRERFRELFTHIFVIETGDRFHRELAKAFKEEVLTVRNGSPFIDETLVPYSEAFQVVTNAAYESATRAEDINRLLGYLSRLDNDDWIPPAMAFYERYKSEPDILLELLRELDRRAYGMFITAVRRDARIARYEPAITAVKSAEMGVNDVIDHLRLTSEEQSDIVYALNGPVYATRPVARYVWPLLLRLDSVLADASVTYDHKTITVEHVLPQSPEDDSEWVLNFPDEDERLEWTNRLANLVLLSRSKNSRAQNYDFDRKKREYFQRGGVPGFALTTQVVNEENWTPAVLQRRQRELVDALKAEWGISSVRRRTR